MMKKLVKFKTYYKNQRGGNYNQKTTFAPKPKMRIHVIDVDKKVVIGNSAQSKCH
jgi:hypothetical protein